MLNCIYFLEAAEFIIISDLEDVLIPRMVKNYKINKNNKY